MQVHDCNTHKRHSYQFGQRSMYLLTFRVSCAVGLGARTYSERFVMVGKATHISCFGAMHAVCSFPVHMSSVKVLDLVLDIHETQIAMKLLRP
eukprot:1742936-Amphidinium_carterae.1